jgi:hypothetical protein
MATVVTNPIAEPQAPPASAPFGLTAEAFLRGVELGLFPADRRVFLWDGRLYEKMAKKLAHAASAETVRSALQAVLPLADLTVIRGTARQYFLRQSVPRAPEIGLVVEMSDTSLRDDRTQVLARYAAAPLAVYWVVNLVAWRIEVYSDPHVEAGVASYTSRVLYGSGDVVPLVLDGVEIARIPVVALLPAEKKPD